jgi:uncharacterized protein YqjF (DUF2071 family)
MHPAFARVDHRPWPVPDRPWSWRQSWHELLFAHWPVPAAVLEPYVPKPLRLQEFDGTSWIALVPFRMSGVMLRPLPDLPWISAFPELNVRLYVEHGGKPGVWFLSLDATNPLAVWAARTFFHLPYFQARMSLAHQGDKVLYRSERPGAGLKAWYRPTSEPYLAEPGTLEHFLTERYCLYARRPDGSILRNEVHHLPWPLQKAEAGIETNTMFAFHGLQAEGPPALLHYAHRLDVVVWGAERVA